MPWKDQLRLAGRCLRWLFWPADQLWLPVLAAFLMYFPVSRLGRK